MNNLKNFIESGKRNMWLVHGPFTMYVRRAVRLVDFAPRLCFDIANIENTQGKGTGQFWTLIEELRTLLAHDPIEGIFVESVLTPRFEDSLLKNGFVLTGPDTHCLYLSLQNNITNAASAKKIEVQQF